MYKLAFPGSFLIDWNPEEDEYREPEEIQFPPLLYSSSFVRKEALPIFYKTTRFEFPLTGFITEEDVVPFRMKKLLRRMLPANISSFCVTSGSTWKTG